MKKICLITGLALSAALLLAPKAKAQTQQDIVITEYNGKEQKTPLSGVSVTVLNAVASVSDAQGKASLRFRTLHAGDKVTVRRIVKSGYEVFNTQALEQWSISPQRPFQIILCQSERFRALRDQYSRVASDSYARQYKAEQARLANLRKKTKMLEETYQQKLTELENQYQQQLEDLENYVDQFARIDLSELNNKQQELIRLVQEGKIEKAIAQYESADYQAQYQRQCEEIARIDKAQAQLATVEARKRSEREDILKTINRQIATYRLAGGRENFDKVTRLLKSVADADTTQLEAVFNYANHALAQHLNADCERYYGIYLRGCAGRPDLQASAWSLLGQGYMLQHEFAQAELAYSKALAIREELARQEPERFTAALIEIQHILSTYYIWVNKVDEANTLLQSAVAPLQKMYAEEPDFYRGKLAEVYANLSQTQYQTGDSLLAFQTIQQAMDLSQQIYAASQESYYLNLVYSNLEWMYYIAQNWTKLAETTQLRLNLTEELYKKNPQEHINDLQSAYNNLAEATLHIPDLEACRKALTRSEQLLDEMEKSQPGQHYSRFNLCDIGAHLYAALGDATLKAKYVEAARAAFAQMSTEDQQQNQALLDALLKL
ncbi:MAG: hypothetical protein K6E86_09725 [Bacteroidales bacterium]|nr:hypothetical protein [Bacteroidales bacterium]